MSRENTFKKRLIETMGKRWHVQSHEDMYSTGIPDLSYGAGGVNGWIELKYITLPSAAGVLKPSKFTPAQINWLNNRHAHGGKCWVMVGVEKSGVYLFEAIFAASIAEGRSESWYQSTSVASWVNRPINPVELLHHLTR